MQFIYLFIHYTIFQEGDIQMYLSQWPVYQMALWTYKMKYKDMKINEQ